MELPNISTRIIFYDSNDSSQNWEMTFPNWLEDIWPDKSQAKSDIKDLLTTVNSRDRMWHRDEKFKNH